MGARGKVRERTRAVPGTPSSSIIPLYGYRVELVLPMQDRRPARLSEGKAGQQSVPLRMPTSNIGA